MDTTGKYPKLSNSDPLFEMADYTQQMSAALNPVATSPIFSNGWTNFGGGYNGLVAKEIVGGVVSLTGMVKGGTLTDGVQIATIAIGLRPLVSVYSTAIIRDGSVNKPGMISITTGGAVFLFGDVPGADYAILNTIYNK